MPAQKAGRDSPLRSLMPGERRGGGSRGKDKPMRDHGRSCLVLQGARLPVCLIQGMHLLLSKVIFPFGEMILNCSVPEHHKFILTNVPFQINYSEWIAHFYEVNRSNDL